MTISTTLFQDMTAYLTPLPFFGNENARRAFLLNAGLEEILTQVNCAGTPQTFVPLLLEFLNQYGNFGEQPALCRLLDGVAKLYGDDKKARFAEFCERVQAEQRAEQQANYAKFSRATPAQQADLDRKMALEREAERQRSERAQQSQQRSIGVKPNVEKLFVDREVYLAELTRAVADDAARLILIVGQGGMGKTALAAKFCDDLEKAGYKIPLLGGVRGGSIDAKEQPTPGPSQEGSRGARGGSTDIPLLGGVRGGSIDANEQPDLSQKVSIRAIIYISRAELQTFTIDHVLRKLAQSLDAEANGRVAPLLGDPRADATVKTEALLDALRGGLTLLVLDNFETLLDNGAIRDPDIAAFLETACATHHGLNIIITSRYDVPLAAFESVRCMRLNTGLRLPDAVGLLRRLGKTVESVCAASDAELEQLATAVYCVPMALKSLVGFLNARRRVTVAHLLRDAGRFAEFKRHDVTAGLRKLIAEQYSLLTSDQQMALQALAVFNAPVAPVAAQSLFPGLDADAALETLAYQLFLAQHNRVTDEFDLHPSVGEYAYEQMNPVPVRLHAHAADFYAQKKKPAAEWKRLSDVQPHLDEIAQRIAAGEYDRAAAVLNEIDFDYLQKWGYCQIVMTLREQLRNHLTISYLNMLNNGYLGLVYKESGHIKEAIPLLEYALKIAYNDDNKLGEGRWLGNLGNVYMDSGEIRQAIEYYTKALVIFRKLGDHYREVAALSSLGIGYFELGEIQQAIDIYMQALVIDREIGDRRGEGIDLGNLGEAYLEFCLQEQMETYIAQTIECHQKALKIHQEAQDAKRIPEEYKRLGIAVLFAGKREQAAAYFQQCLTACDAALANAQLYEVLYYRAFALLALQAVAPASAPPGAPLAAYQQALAACSAAGVVKEQIHEIECWQQICARRGLAAPLAPDALALLCAAANG